MEATVEESATYRDSILINISVLATRSTVENSRVLATVALRALTSYSVYLGVIRGF